MKNNNQNPYVALIRKNILAFLGVLKQIVEYPLFSMAAAKDLTLRDDIQMSDSEILRLGFGIRRSDGLRESMP